MAGLGVDAGAGLPSERGHGGFASAPNAARLRASRPSPLAHRPLMRARLPSAAFLLIATTSAPLAAPATLDGARAIERGYADAFGKAAIDEGVVSVAPDGDDYLVSWDLQKALDLAGAPTGALRIGRFSYRLKPTGEGAWTATADQFPSLAFDVPTDKGKMTGTLDFAGFRLDAASDPAQTNFLRSLIAADSLDGKFHLA